MPSKIYRLICIVDSINKGGDTISTMDASPDYLHIHILDSEHLNPIDSPIREIPEKETSNTLYQWGTIFEKDTHTRSTKVSAAEIKKYGQIGIGSASRGSNERIGDFIGGGEAFLFDAQNFRITKGNGMFEAGDEQEYWTFQVADFSDALRTDDLLDQVISGRDNLMEILKLKSGGEPFIATFDVTFNDEFFARSNGILPEDVSFIEDPNLALFDTEIKGGHLVGGSQNTGDIESLKQKFTDESIDIVDFSLQIVSPVFLKPINELKIAKKNGEFRNPRTEIEVNKASQLIQDKWKEHKGI